MQFWWFKDDQFQISSRKQKKKIFHTSAWWSLKVYVIFQRYSVLRPKHSKWKTSYCYFLVFKNIFVGKRQNEGEQRKSSGFFCYWTSFFVTVSKMRNQCRHLFITVFLRAANGRQRCSYFWQRFLCLAYYP